MEKEVKNPQPVIGESGNVEGMEEPEGGKTLQDELYFNYLCKYFNDENGFYEV